VARKINKEIHRSVKDGEKKKKKKILMTSGGRGCGERGNGERSALAGQKESL
jgi:hypothetical protein